MPRTSSRTTASTSSALGTKKKANDSKASTSNKRQKSTRSSAFVWSESLYRYLDDPADPAVVYVDDKVIAIKDKYPKAKHHYLVMPRDKSIKSLKDINEENKELLDYMEAVGNRLVCDNNENGDPHLEYRMGFHAMPSMTHLHMHVISQDFNSEHLKNKKHWNSFTTTFFVPVDEVRGALSQEGGSTDYSYREKRLKDGLKCHRCGKVQSSMPSLKKHIASCDVDPRRKEGTY